MKFIKQLTEEETGVLTDVKIYTKTEKTECAWMSVMNPDGTWFDLVVSDNKNIRGKNKCNSEIMETVVDWMYLNWDILLDLWKGNLEAVEDLIKL